MPVLHTFVNPIADEPGFLGTKPSDWNDPHSVSIENADVDAAAGIEESKLSLNFPTHAPVTLGVSNGLSLSGQQLSMALAGANSTGTLSAQDWNAFNSKQSALSFPLVASLGGTSISNTGTFTNHSNTIIVGGGTLSLGGFTLTVPATGTAALLGTANVFTTAQTITPATNVVGLTVNKSTSVDFFQLKSGANIVGQIDASSRFIANMNGISATSRNYGFYPFYQNSFEYGFEIGHSPASSRYALQLITPNQADLRYRTYLSHPNAQADFIDLWVVNGQTGAMGLGVSAPNNMLEIRKDQSSPTSIQITNTSTTGNAQTRIILFGGSGGGAGTFGIVNSGNTSYPAFANWFIANANGALDGIAFWTESSKPIKFATNNVDALVLDGSTGQATSISRSTTNNAVSETMRLLSYISTASAGGANGFGTGLTFYAETATDDTNQQQGLISTSWIDATNASRKAKMSLSAYDTAARLGIEIEASGTEAKLGFYGVATIARAVLATGVSATVDDVITALQNLGLVKQS